MFEGIKRWLTRERPQTEDYKPTNYFGWAYFDFDLPIFSLAYADLMRRDSRVAFGLALRDGPLELAEIKVECGHSKVQRFVEQQWQKIWQAHSDKIVRTKCYGYSGFEVMYRMERGQIVFHDLLDRHPRDTRPLTRGGKLKAIRVYNFPSHVRNSQDSLIVKGNDVLPFPKCLWLTYRAEYGRWFGMSALERAYPAWYAKVRKHGARELMQMRMLKDAWCGDVLKYPNENLRDQNNEDVKARDVAREMLTMRTTGASIALPSTTYTDGSPKWEFITATETKGVTPILEYKHELDDDVFEALEIPGEVAEAMSSGSGFSGRSIPFIVFALMLKNELNDYVRQIKQQILDPLVLMNFNVRSNQYKVEAADLLDAIGKLMGGQQRDGDGDGMAGEGSTVPRNQPPAVVGQHAGSGAGGGMFGNGGGRLALSQDAHGNEHAPAGSKKGGQFVSKGKGGSGSTGATEPSGTNYMDGGKRWNIRVDQGRGAIVVSGKGKGLPERYVIPLDQVRGEKHLIALHKAGAIPKSVKFNVEKLHSEHRRNTLQAVGQTPAKAKPRVKERQAGMHSAFHGYTLDELQDELRMMHSGKIKTFNSHDFVTPNDHLMALEEEIYARQAPSGRGRMFASPNTGPYAGETHKDYAGSAAANHRPYQVSKRKLSDSVVQQFGLSAQGKPAVGTWVDTETGQTEGEEAFAYSFTDVKSADQLDALAAAVAIETHQKAVIRFQERPDGENAEYTFTIPGAARHGQEIQETLVTQGLHYSTLIPTQDGGLTVSIISFDPAQDQPGIETVADAYDVGVEMSRGEAKMVGESQREAFAGQNTRADARRNAAEVLANSTTPLPEKYREAAKRLIDYRARQKPDRGETGGPDAGPTRLSWQFDARGDADRSVRSERRSHAANAGRSRAGGASRPGMTHEALAARVSRFFREG